jgi:predicted MFS family arabinose efflux permease
VSFACASLAALDYIGRSQGARASGMALYLAVYVTAGLCGSGLGALIVDQAGIHAVFIVGLGCSALGMALLGRLPDAAGQPRKASLRLAGSLLALLRQPAFTSLLAMVALPMQVVQQGLLFYWTPLALASLDQPTSTTGLAMMGYFLMVLGCNRAAAGFADRTGGHRSLVALSLAISGACAVQAGFGLTPAAIVVTAVAIGVAWALGFPSLGALSLQVSQRELAGVEPAVTLGLYRSIERIGAMLAPPVTGLLIALTGYARAASILGAILLGCALAWWVLSRRRSR